MGYIGDDPAAAPGCFNGLEERHSKPRSMIYKAAMEDALEDLALTKQFLSDKQLDESSALTSLDPQAHDGTNGALLGHPLGSLNIGRGGGTISTDFTIKWPRFLCDQITTQDHRVVNRMPVFIPSGHSKIAVNVRCQEHIWSLNPAIQVFDTSWSEDGDPVYASDYNVVNRNGTMDLWFDVPITSPGAVHIMSLDFMTSTYSDAQDSKLYSARYLPRDWQQVNAAPPNGQVFGASTTSQPHRLTSFKNIHDVLCTDDYPLNSLLTAEGMSNACLLHERLTGAPAPGYTSLQATAHNHDGSVAGGPTIDMALGAYGYGAILDPASAVDGFASGMLDYGAAPVIDDVAMTAYYDGPYMILQMPERSGATFTLNWAAVLYDRYGDGITARFLTADDLTAWDYTSATGTESWDSSGYWCYAYGTVTAKSDAINYCKPQFRQDTAKPGDPLVYITGACCWVEAS